MEAYLEGKIQGYEQLRDFMKAAIQLIKGKHSTKDFKEGSNEEYMEATKKAGALYLISEKLNTKVVFRRDIVVAFYRVWDKIPSTSNDWVRSKCRSLNPVGNGRERTRTYCGRTSISQ